MRRAAVPLLLRTALPNILLRIIHVDSIALLLFWGVVLDDFDLYITKRPQIQISRLFFRMTRFTIRRIDILRLPLALSPSGRTRCARVRFLIIVFYRSACVVVAVLIAALVGARRRIQGFALAIKIVPWRFHCLLDFSLARFGAVVFCGLVERASTPLLT